MHRYSKSTALNGVVMARAYEDALTNSTGNTYVGVGQVSSSFGTPVATESLNKYSDLFQNLVAIKKITSSDINLVVPDVVWATSVVYDQFNSGDEMYSHETLTRLTGNVNISSSSTGMSNGTSATLFSNELSIGDIIQLSGIGTENYPIRREVIAIDSNTNLTINLASEFTYTNNLAYKVADAYPNYGKNFYVRNSYDQVFICIFNNGDTASIVEPVLRPENFSMGKLVQSTTDGYIWRYLYTIPSGLKEKFLFTDADSQSWMPVTTDAIVASTATDGAIEHIRILDSGSGYNSNTACSNVDIITISGDGTGASYVANVYQSAALDSTTIAELISANNGAGYSFATVTTTDTSGTGASFEALIGPPGGFGYDPAKDLGAKFVALSVEFASNVSGTLPISSSAGSVAFRQVSVIRNPQYANNTYVSTGELALTSNVEVAVSSTPSVGTRVVQNSGYEGTVVAFTNPYLLLNNTKGTFANTGPFTSGVIGNAQALNTSGVKRSGDILFMENIAAVTRTTNQAEQIKLVFKF
jgi:hypothetical protein